jgi:hypothetical protein
VGTYRGFATPFGGQVRDPRDPSERRPPVPRQGSRPVRGPFVLPVKARNIPADADEERILRGVLRAVETELVRPREHMAPDHEAPLVPTDFG